MFRYTIEFQTTFACGGGVGGGGVNPNYVQEFDHRTEPGNDTVLGDSISYDIYGSLRLGVFLLQGGAFSLSRDRKLARQNKRIN
jgi:hypothetical protein